MSLHDKVARTTLGGKIGCLAAALAGLPVFFFALIFAFGGDCFDVEQCHQGEWPRFAGGIAFTAVVATLVGLITRDVVNALRRK